jgi:hypothetical protein
MPIIRSLSTAVAASVYRWNVVVAVLLVVVGPAGVDNNQQHCCYHVPTVKRGGYYS